MNVKENNAAAFKQIYIAHYSRLKNFAREYVIREEDAENIVQDLFLELWENKYFLTPHIHLYAYLLSSVKNRCIDFLRHATTVSKTAERMQSDFERLLQIKFDSLESLDVDQFSQSEMEQIIQNALNQLPEKCREIFILNKIEGKKQQVIANELNISINTVETQMAIAYKKLRILLKDLKLIYLFLNF